MCFRKKGGKRADGRAYLNLTPAAKFVDTGKSCLKKNRKITRRRGLRAQNEVKRIYKIQKTWVGNANRA